MANEENLRPCQNTEEARERGRLGGLKSGEAKRKAKSLREAMKNLLMLETKNEKGEAISGYERIVLALYEKAVNGDTYAINSLRDLIGENPTQKFDGNVDNSLIVEFNIPRPKSRAKQEKSKKEDE